MGNLVYKPLLSHDAQEEATRAKPSVVHFLRHRKSADFRDEPWKKQAVVALKKLCQRCDENRLLDLFEKMACPQSFDADGPIKHRRLSLRPLDSWETALDPKDGRPSITQKELEERAKMASKLSDFVWRLSHTPLGRELMKAGEIPEGDLLTAKGVVVPSLRRFWGLRNLPRLAKRRLSFGRAKWDRPDTRPLLNAIYDHIQACWNWKQSHDSLVADVLNGLGVDATSEGLKQWRRREGKQLPRKVT